MRIWVTGFEPFEGVPENPSALAVEALPPTIDGHPVARMILPVDTVRVGECLRGIYDEAPDVLLHVGVAEKRDHVCVERIAVNRRLFRMPDNAGHQEDSCVISGAPDRLESRFPVDTLVAALREADLPAEPSDDAGMFLCNQVMFQSLALLPPTTKTGFLHVPGHPPLATRHGRVGLPVPRITDAIVTVLRTLIALAVLMLSFVPAASAAKPLPFMKGMTVSCPGYGQIWGAPAMVEALAELEKLGVEWVAIHPYAGVRKDGSIRWEPAADTGYLPRAVTITKKAKTHLFWKPHLAYWGSFQWRGAIDFGENEAAWRRFFDDYRHFIVDQAKFAERAKAPLFSVGIEYAKTMRFEKEWRRIIREVRRVYRGKITYSANWDDYERVPFWDALDVIGVQAYFPVGGKKPTRASILASWDEHIKRLLALSDKHGKKPILFTEIGYSSSLKAASEPWKPDVDRSEEARALRVLLLEVALVRIAREPRIRGMFWWKWLPGRAFFDRDFSMKDEEARRVLGRYW